MDKMKLIIFYYEHFAMCLKQRVQKSELTFLMSSRMGSYICK